MSKAVLVNSEEVHLFIDEGVPWSFSITLTDANGAAIDITGHDISMDVKDEIGGTVLLAKTDALGGDITNGGATGVITIAFADDDLIGATWERGVYDVKVDGLVRALRGDVIINRQVTI